VISLLIYYVRKKFSFVCVFWQVFVDIFLENYIIHDSIREAFRMILSERGCFFFTKIHLIQKTSQTYVL
jgi:hypothetical protein